MNGIELAGAIGAGILGGGVFTCFVAYFSFTTLFRDYIREAVGKVPEVVATTRQEQRMATFDELKQLRDEFEKHSEGTDRRLDKISDDAIDGRRRLHEDLSKGFNGMHEKVNEIALDLTNKVAELRGELKRIVR